MKKAKRSPRRVCTAGKPLVQKVCATRRLFLINVFSRTCAGKKHRNPSIFRKKSAKPARRPELHSAASQPRPFWAAPPVRRKAQEARGSGDRSLSNEMGSPQKQSFCGETKPSEAVFRQSRSPQRVCAAGIGSKQGAYRALVRTSSQSLRAKSARGMFSVSPVLRERTATTFSSASLSPRTSI